MAKNRLVCILLAVAVPVCAQSHHAREFIYVPMQDGVRLAAVVYRAAQGSKFPVLVTYNPYTGGGTDFTPDIEDYINHGYAVVAASIRGTGCSEGSYYRNQAPSESEDGVSLVEWAAAQAWSTGDVGMFGNSYPGNVQITIAALHPKHLKVIAAGGLTGSGYDQNSYPGGIFNSGQAATWNFASQPALSSAGARLRIEAGDKACAAIQAKQAPIERFARRAEHPLRDSSWGTPPASRATRIEIPAFIFQGWQDEQCAVNGGIQVFQGIKGPKRLLLSNGMHAFYGVEPARAERIRWYDRWLKGEQNGIDKEPPVNIWFETRFGEKLQAAPGWKAAFSAWPPPEAKWTTWFMAADGALIAKPPSEGRETGRRTYFFPSGTELPATNEAFRIAPVTIGRVLYRSQPMPEDTTVLGSSLVTFYAAADQKDTDFMVVLHDVDEKKNVTYMQRGFLRASHRAVDAKKSRPHEPYHPHDKLEELAPGEIYEFQIALYAVGHVLRRGHALELAIMAPPVVPLPHWGFTLVPLPGRVHIYSSPQQLSRIELPVVPALKAQAPAPECGSLRLQPCRPAVKGRM